ncbi:MAG: hypothetical protein IKE43_00290, partial [Coriobacteriales bacterium]|nr:hypothetical protein [Coriobacteriales bacterium]
MAGFDKNNMPFGMKIVVVIFAVILVVSLCLPFFSSCNLPGQEPQNTAQEETTQQEDEGVTTANATTAADIDASYEAQKLELESKLESDQNNLSALANLGNLYYSWAQDLKSIASETNLELIESSEPADSDGETTS